MKLETGERLTKETKLDFCKSRAHAKVELVVAIVFKFKTRTFSMHNNKQTDPLERRKTICVYL